MGFPSCINQESLSVLLSLSLILRPITCLNFLVGGTPSHVRNSLEFVCFVRDQHLFVGEILISYHVVSLFTNVPVDLACRVARDRLLSDPTLEDRMSLSLDQVTSLLEFCLGVTYLSFQGAYYQQVFGTAMGSISGVGDNS